MRLIVLGLTIHLVSSILQVYFTSGFSIIIVLAGLILYFWGEKVLQKVAFPIAFMIFMVPLPLVTVTNFSFNLKLFAAELAARILNEMRIPAIQDGSIIKMRSAFVVVDDVCSGLRSLISLTALGSLFVYWMKSTFLKRAILLIATVPIAIITNVCRVVFLSSVSEIWGPQYATGFIHDLSGFMVFALAIVLLYLLKSIFE